MDVRQDSPGPTYVRPSRRVDTRSTYRGWLLHRGVSRQVPLGLNATLTLQMPRSLENATFATSVLMLSTIKQRDYIECPVVRPYY